jgi:hypothetical protein
VSKKIPWVRVLAEGAVIVGSILLAFAIDAAWDTRNDRVEEAEELTRLEAEFQANHAEFSEDVELGDTFHREVTALLALLDSGADGTRIVAPDSLVSSLLFAPIWEPEAAVYGALVTSGRIRLLRNRELIEAMATWESRVSNTQENQRRARALYVDEILPYLRRDNDIVGLLSGRLNVPSLVPSDSTGPSIPSGPRETTLLNTPELRNLVAQFRLFSGLAQRSARRALPTIEGATL